LDRRACSLLFNRSANSESNKKAEEAEAMTLRLAAIFLIVCCGSAFAQSGITNQRDAQGNLVRDGGVYSPRGVNQGPINNGPIRNAPAQPPTFNAGQQRAVR
jgi:hypothetical protein